MMIQAERDFHHRWPSLLPPLRPHDSVAAAISALLPESGLPVLLLGVTPELAVVPHNVLALDWSMQMIDAAWIGDTARRKVICGNWLAMPLAPHSVGAAISDGALSMLHYPEEQPQLFDQLRTVIVPGGRIILRCFATPEPAEPLDAVCAEAMSGSLTFHHFKMRFNMAAAAESGDENIASAALFTLFDARFPDRRALSEASGWSLDSISEIDAYRGSKYIHCYPSRSDVLRVVPDWAKSVRFVETSGYPGAEHCPLLVIDLP